MTLYTGGCSCGSIRFALSEYLYVLTCHCSACKKRTGSVFGISVVAENHGITQISGRSQKYTRIAESGRPVHYEFCPACATTVLWRIEAAPERTIFAGGAFDDMRALDPAGEMYHENKLSWARVECSLSRAGEPDSAFRAALIARAKILRE
jgi:hypothetical protein